MRNYLGKTLFYDLVVLIRLEGWELLDDPARPSNLASDRPAVSAGPQSEQHALVMRGEIARAPSDPSYDAALIDK